MLKELKIGTIEGRHQMPVSEFIFTNTITNPFNFEMMDEVIDSKLDGVDVVHLYVTGLTQVTTQVVKYCYKRGISLTLYHFDRDSGSYTPQEIFTFKM